MKYIEKYKLEFATDKYVIWGRGSVLDFIDSKLKIIENTDFFIETSPNTKLFLNKRVIGIEEFISANYDKDEYTILVCTSLWNEIVLNLDTQIIEKFPIVNLYEKFKIDIINENLEITRQYKRMENFIDTYNKGNFSRSSDNKSEKVLIMIKEWTGSVIPFHQIALGMLLKSNGIDVEFLFNDKSIYGDIILYEGAVEYQNEIIEVILKKVKEKANISYYRLSNSQEVKLNEVEYTNLTKALYYNKVWHSKKIIFESIDKDLKLLEKNWFENAGLIKNFLTVYEFNKIVAFTGAHFDWAILNILAKELEKKVYTCEYARGGYSFSLSGATVLQKDVALFDDLIIDDLVLNFLIDYADKHIESRFPKEVNDNEPSVLIPLNIFWDSAAFGENDLFVNFDDWLLKTISYILENHKIKVVVRQHPHENKYQTGKEVEKILVSSFGNNPLFKFIPSSSNMDTYELMKNANLILPNTSSVGLEGAMMGKNVIVKNDVYYANSGFVKKAKNIEDYFNLINSSLRQEDLLSKSDIEKAKIYFGLTMHNRVDCTFGQKEIDFEVWAEDSFDNLSEYKSVKWLLDTIIYDKPLLANFIEEKLLDLN